MYYCIDSEELTVNSSFVDLGNQTEVDIPGSFTELQSLDGVYKVAIVAYDEEQNYSESSPEIIVPLDFAPPEPPGSPTIS